MKFQISDVQHFRLQRVMEVCFETMQNTRALYQHQEDLDSGNGRVWLPHALERKYRMQMPTPTGSEEPGEWVVEW